MTLFTAPLFIGSLPRFYQAACHGQSNIRERYFLTVIVHYRENQFSKSIISLYEYVIVYAASYAYLQLSYKLYPRRRRRLADMIAIVLSTLSYAIGTQDRVTKILFYVDSFVDI